MFFKFKDYNIYYEVHGTGEPLLILNGIMMSTKSWGFFLPALSKNNRIILVDFLDQGQSSKCEIDYDHAIQVELVVALLDHLKLERVNLFGISYGGQIALQVCLVAPKRVAKLCLSNTSYETSDWLREIGHGWNAAASDGYQYYLTSIPIIYSPHFFNSRIEWMKNRERVLVDVFNDKAFIEAMVRLTKSSENYQIKDRVHLIEHQTLIIGSEFDFLTPFFQQQALHQKLKRSELVFVPQAGHALMYEKPNLFVSLLLGFLEHTQDIMI